jgi:hypothetical protein
MVTASAGRTDRRWRERTRPGVLNASDICHWCGHPGARAVDHIIPRSIAPELANDPANLAPIHGIEGCDYCPTRRGKRRVCNGEKGNKVNAVPPDHGSRPW